MKRTIAAFALVLSPVLAPAQGQRATLALLNGHVVTMDSAKPEAQAIAIAGDRIIAVGTNEEIQRTIGTSTKVVNLTGRLATPRFADGHGHYMALSSSKLQPHPTKA